MGKEKHSLFPSIQMTPLLRVVRGEADTNLGNVSPSRGSGKKAEEVGDGHTQKNRMGGTGSQRFSENRASVLSVLTGQRGHRSGPMGHTGPA